MIGRLTLPSRRICLRVLLHARSARESDLDYIALTERLHINRDVCWHTPEDFGVDEHAAENNVYQREQCSGGVSDLHDAIFSAQNAGGPAQNR